MVLKVQTFRKYFDIAQAEVRSGPIGEVIKNHAQRFEYLDYFMNIKPNEDDIKMFLKLSL